MRNSSNWRWCVVGNIRAEKNSPRRTPLTPMKKVYIGKDYDPKTREVTVAWLNIRGHSAVIARIPIQRLTNIRVIKSCNSWSLQMMSDLETDNLWWSNTVADMNDAEEYRDMLRADKKLQKPSET